MPPLRHAAALALLGSCTPSPPAPDQVHIRGQLRVVTIDSPTTYYLGAGGPEGLEFQLASAFARRLGVNLYMYPVANVRAMQCGAGLRASRYCCGAADGDAGWRKAGEPANVYDRIPQLVVFHRGDARPRETLRMESARLSVRAGSPQEHMLERLKRTVAPALGWIETAPSAADPLEDVQTGDAQYAVVDGREFSFSHHLYPDVRPGVLPARRTPRAVDRPARRPRALRGRQSLFPFDHRDRRAAGSDGRVLRGFTALPVRGVARVPGEHVGSTAALSRLVRGGLRGDRRRLAFARRHRLPGIQWDPKAAVPNGRLGRDDAHPNTAGCAGREDRSECPPEHHRRGALLPGSA